MRKRILAGLLVVCSGLLVACSGGGGGDSADGVQPGPPPPGGPVDPTPPDLPDPPPSPYAEAQRLIATITSVSLNGDNQAVVEFQLTDGSNIAITDLTVDDVRFVIAKLAASSLGNLTGNWQSYVNDIETAGSVGPGTQDRLQATYERDGEFVNNGDGTYVYTFATSLSDLPQEILDQAAVEGLDLSFEDDRTHRVAIQFDNSNSTANPNYDWVPATGALASFSRDIAATENCNACHDPLGIHGGNRREIEYCVTCHNPGSTDANSGNTVDMKVMVHKIHMGRDLPSVQDGGEYAIYGFRDSKHDYSDLGYPQDIRNCVNCHVGTGTVGEREDLVLTAQGDNWAEVASMAACGSCHEDLDFSVHAGGQEDDSGCGSCHSAGGPAGSIADSHRILSQEASARFAAEVVRVVNSMPGDVPRAVIAISNPETGERYDLHNDPEFEGGSVNVRVSWDTRDYHNTGNGAEDAGSISASALSGSTDNGNGTYSVSMPIALPDGSEPPGVAASGSGVAVVEGRLSLVLEEGADAETVPLVNAHGFFSIDEPDAVAVPRRDSVELGACLACHGSLSLHGGNRTDSINSCVTCHNPRNTDREVREIAADPPTDGKAEESLHFKTMIHGIHAAAMRENPLQIVGRNGGTTHVYDEEEVHYPGNLANCTACHGDSGFGLALADGVLGTTVDTGADHTDPADDTVVSPMAAACASCHDSDVAAAHMESQGASFATSQAALDSGAVVETCVVCHGEGKANDAWVSHQSFLD
tara:strand:+ start:1008 stop:3281 length:2274 start_codon:yes stop_codon:yes gene_type:complete